MPRRVPPSPGFERSLAVVIGINTYSHGILPLQNAVRDANAIADTLERQGFEVVRILDMEATLSRLSELLSERLTSQEPPLDRLLIYFAGHGLAHSAPEHPFSGFLLPADARRDELSSYWPMASLREALRRLSCRHLLLILDCCFAGAFPHASRDLRPPPEPAPLFLERFRHFSSHRSFQLLVSTSHDELATDRLHSKPSQEVLGQGLHSPFAVALLEALEASSPADFNQDGLLTAAELYTFLRDRLLTLLPSHHQQTPSLWYLDWHDGGEFLFLLRDSLPPLPSAAPLLKDSNPYLGSRAFSAAHRHRFFGRERLIDGLVQRLHTRPLLVLHGPSGAGKSSLVHAGLLPRLQEDASWIVPPTLHPSAQPLQQLAAWLGALSEDTATPSAAALAAQPHSAADFLRTFLARQPHRSVLLVIDPLEQLLTTCPHESLRLAFLRALASLLQLSHPRLRLLILLRTDFEPRFLSALPPAYLSLEVWRDSRFQLPAMNRDELRRCIQEPAKACVLFFSSGLVERLLDDVEQMPGTLPLLSLVLSTLFDAYLDSGRDDRTLSFEDYQRLGGLAGVLQRRAELVISGALPPLAESSAPLPPVSPRELPALQRTLRSVMLRLVSPEGGELTRRRVPLTELEYPLPEENARVERALRTLEAFHLVIASHDEGPCVELAHDALLSAWPRLRSEASQAHSELLLLRRISRAASEWLRHHRATPFLWADERLEQLGLIAASLRRNDARLELSTVPPGGHPTEPLLFNVSERSFLRASAGRLRWLRTRSSLLGLGVATWHLILLGTALFLVDRANRHARQTDLELASLRLLQVERLLPRDPTQALLTLETVMNRLPDEPNPPWLQTAVDVGQHAVTGAILAEYQRIRVVAFSPDGSRVLTVTDDTVRLWNTDGSGLPLLLKGHEGPITSATFSPDGLWVLTASDDGTARLWSVDGSRPSRVLRGHTRRVASAAFSPDGSRVVTASYDGTARLWSVDGGHPPITLWGHTSHVLSAAFSPDGSRVITTSDDQTARIWSAEGSGPPIVLQGHQRAVTSARFSPDGSRVLTSSEDCTARLWNADGSGLPIILEELSGWVTSAAFSPDGTSILTVSDDQTAHLWSADGHHLHHQGGISAATFHPESSSILTASDDGTLRLWRTEPNSMDRLWSVEDSLLLSFQAPRGRVTHATFSPDGLHVLAALADGTVRIWRTHGTVSLFAGPRRRATTAAFSPDGRRVLSGFADGTARLWTLDGSRPPLVLAGHTGQVVSAAFTPNGERVLTASDDRTVRLWAADGTLLRTLQGHEGAVKSATFSPDGQSILTTSQDGTARLWSAEGSGPPIILRGHAGTVFSGTFSPDGSRVLTASEDGTVRYWPTEVRGALQGRRDAAWSVTMDPDGSLVFAADPTDTARPHAAKSQSAPAFNVLLSLRDWIYDVTFSPDGSRVLIRSRDGTARIFAASGRGPLLILQGQDGSDVTSATFSPDGQYVLTTAQDHKARIWRADGSGLPIILQGEQELVTSAAFSPSLEHPRVLTLSQDGTARLWSPDGQGVPLILPAPGSSTSEAGGERVGSANADEDEQVPHAVFSPDGRQVLTASWNGLVRVWPIDPALLRDSLQKATTVCFGPEERRENLLEPPSKAQSDFTECERSHHRLP